MCELNPVTVSVLPVSVVRLAKDPGKSFPFVIETLIADKEIVVVVPSNSLITNVELAPVGSTKNSLLSLFGSDILNCAWPVVTTSVNTFVSWYIF